MDHYAESFTITPGHCWRMVHDPELRKIGHTIHCPEPVRSRGVYRTEEGKRFRVESCEGHSEELEGVRAAGWLE